MTNYEYACWVRGYLQLCPDISLDRKKIIILKNHLNLVAAVSGNLGEKNQMVFNRIVEIQQNSANQSTYEAFKQFLLNTYLDS